MPLRLAGVPARRARDVAGGALLVAGFRQRQVCPGLVAVAAPVLVLDLVAGLGRAGDGAVGAAFGDARLAAKSRTRTFRAPIGCKTIMPIKPSAICVI